ncbi:group XIIA secretory phospholipase A2 isoform X2 [Schistocerca gregaria]|uniref:group XIIA secretory phospholipase A2 isoform X2 n=1 Tax=Schistocerca gregaria TaxID=7010 RepID=UPI00211F2B40|nr:group XIIA secretory phospholipase A2 isoform X2 [Schistocerca gregaria]
MSVLRVALLLCVVTAVNSDTIDISEYVNNFLKQHMGYKDGIGGVMEKIFDGKAVETLYTMFKGDDSSCSFVCPDGEKPKKNKYHTPSSDGCGSQGLKIDNEYLPVGDMTNCCNDHDICYDTCGSDKEKCDLEFKRCLYKICEKHQKLITDKGVKACKAAAKMLFTGTLTLGCKSFLDSQKRACFCPSSKRTEF